MKHCTDPAFLLGSVKSDPLDAWGEQSELEIEGGRLINPLPPRSPLLQPRPSRDVKKRRRQKKEIFEKLPRVRCHAASCVDWAALFVMRRHEYWVDVKRRMEGGGAREKGTREEKTKHWGIETKPKEKNELDLLNVWCFLNLLLCKCLRWREIRD